MKEEGKIKKMWNMVEGRRKVFYSDLGTLCPVTAQKKTDQQFVCLHSQRAHYPLLAPTQPSVDKTTNKINMTVYHTAVQSKPACLPLSLLCVRMVEICSFRFYSKQTLSILFVSGCFCMLRFVVVVFCRSSFPSPVLCSEDP